MKGDPPKKHLRLAITICTFGNHCNICLGVSSSLVIQHPGFFQVDKMTSHADYQDLFRHPSGAAIYL